MFEWRGIWLPDGETHLIEWMEETGQERAGFPCYQLHKYDRVLQLAGRRRVAVDVGAHVGLWTRVMALDFERVICFEPKPDHQDCWRRNMEGVTNVMLHGCALGPGPGRVTLQTGPSSSGDTWVDPEAEGGDVEMYTLDSFGLDVIDLLKIDCEGYELRVLQGAQETLLRCRPAIIVEQKPGHAEKYGLTEKEAVEFLKVLGAVTRGGIQGDYFLTWPEGP